jgi:hypothetical protein
LPSSTAPEAASPAAAAPPPAVLTEPILDLRFAGRSCPNHPSLVGVYVGYILNEPMCRDCIIARDKLKPAAAATSSLKVQTVRTVAGEFQWKVDPSKAVDAAPPAVYYDARQPPLAAYVIAALSKKKIQFKANDSTHFQPQSDGPVFRDSIAIARYLSRTHQSLQIYPSSNPFIQSQIDSIIDSAILHSKHPEASPLESLLNSLFHSNATYLLGNQLTLAGPHFFFFSHFQIFSEMLFFCCCCRSCCLGSFDTTE